MHTIDLYPTIGPFLRVALPFALVSLAAVGCGGDNPLVGTWTLGPDAAVGAEGEDAWVAQVSQGEGDEHRSCTGALIGPHAVLTRAECATGGAAVDVLFGPDARFAQRHPVTRVVVEPGRGELAVLVLLDRVDVPTVQRAYDELAPGDEVDVIGYGLSAPGVSVLGVKRRTRWVVENVAEGRVTLHAPSESLCWGDVGAPVVDMRGRVVALVDAVPTACQAGSRATARLLSGAGSFVDEEADLVP